MASQSMNYTEEKQLQTNAFTREGYTFAGWAPNATGEIVFADGQIVQGLVSDGGTLTLYALWKRNPVATPVITPGDGTIFIGESCEVVISCSTAGAVIYYSTNGVTPRPTEPFRYVGPFEIAGSANITAVAVLDGVKSEYATVSIQWMNLTLSEAAGAPELPFATGGNTVWEPIVDVTSETGLAVQGGNIGEENETWLETTVSGAGIFAFAWKVDCERDDSGRVTWDHLSVSVDGAEVARIDGATEWAKMSLEIKGKGEHKVRWSFSKDDYDEGPGCRDLAWVSSVQWSPEGGEDPLPEIKDDAEVATVLCGAADVRLAAKILTVEEYEAFRAWVEEKGIDHEAAMGSKYAWLSYWWGAGALFENEPVVELGEVSVGGYEGTRSVAGTTFVVSVTVKDGGRVVKVDAEKVTGLFECTKDLSDWTGEAALAPTVVRKSDEGDALRFEVTPGDGTATRAFLRIGECADAE